MRTPGGTLPFTTAAALQADTTFENLSTTCLGWSRVSSLPTAAAPDLRDRTAFTAAFDAYAGGVHAAALAVLGDPVRAQDVVQDVFLRLWRRPEAFDPARASLAGYLRA